MSCEINKGPTQTKEETVVSPRSNMEDGERLTSKKQSQDLSLNPKHVLRFTAPEEGSSAPLKSKSDTTHDSSKRFFKGNLKLSKLKWPSLEEKLKKSLTNSAKSSKTPDEMEPTRGTNSPRLPHKHGRKGASLDNIQENIPETRTSPRFLERRLDENCRREIRRGSICEELEKMMFYQEYSLHKLREAIVVRHNLQERFLI